MIAVDTSSLRRFLAFRAVVLRGKAIAAGHKSKVADALIAQSCLDHEVGLVTHDRDFRHYTHYGLVLLA